MDRPPCQKDDGIARLFGKAQALYREIGRALAGVPLAVLRRLFDPSSPLGDSSLFRLSVSLRM
jgi:hypothetical protein